MADGALPGLLSDEPISAGAMMRPFPRGFRLNSADMINRLYGPLQGEFRQTPEETRNAALSMALMALPLGPMAGLASRAIAAAPVTSAVAGSLAGLLGMTNAIGGDDDGLTNAQREERTALKKKIERGMFGSAADRRQSERRLSELDGITTTYMKDANAAMQSKIAADRLKADAARRDVIDHAPKSFAEAYPWYTQLGPAIPAAVAMAGTMIPEMRAASGLANTVKDWRRAVTVAEGAKDATTLANNSNVAKAFADRVTKSGGWQKTVPGLAAGGLIGAEFANVPYEFDANLPQLNPEKKAYQEAMKMLPETHPDMSKLREIYEGLDERNPAQRAALEYFQKPAELIGRTAVGAGAGILGSTVSKLAGKAARPSTEGMPFAQTNALLDRFSEIKNRIAEAKGFHITSTNAEAALAAARARAAQLEETPVPVPVRQPEPQIMPPAGADTPATRSRRYINRF